MTKKKSGQLAPTNILDYPITMSAYERESRAAEAILADSKIKKPQKPAKAKLPTTRLS